MAELPGANQSQGAGWWQANDGKWYPPELHPDYREGALLEGGDTNRAETTCDVDYWWDTSDQRHPKWYAQQCREGIWLTDSLRTGWPVDLDRYGIDDEEKVVAALGSAFPGAQIASIVPRSGEEQRMMQYEAPWSGTTSVADELQKLAQLRDQGVLTDIEFQEQKTKLLQEAPPRIPDTSIPTSAPMADFGSQFPYPGPVPAAAANGNPTQGLAAMGVLQGRPMDEIVAVLGAPMSVSSGGNGVRLVQWMHTSGGPQPSWHYAMLFDEHDICGGITHQSVQPGRV